MAHTDQLDLLRAMLTGDFDKQGEVSGQLTQDDWSQYGVVIGAAFFLAVRQRLGSGYSPADVVNLVADVRLRFDPDGDSYDPRAAELLVRAALGESTETEHYSDKTIVGIQAITVGALAADGSIGNVDEFLSKVETLAAQWDD